MEKVKKGQNNTEKLLQAPLKISKLITVNKSYLEINKEYPTDTHENGISDI